MPVTPLLTAELDLTPDMATSSQVLTIDNDGDGVVDATSSPHEAVTSESDVSGRNKSTKGYFQWIRTMIISLHLPSSKERFELSKIDKILDLLNKGKRIKVGDAAQHAAESIPSEHWAFKKVDDTKRQALLGVFDTILDSISEDK